MGLLDPALYTEAASPRNEPAELIVLIQIRDKVLYTIGQGTHHPLQILLIVSQLTQGTLHCLIFRLNVCVPVRVTLSILSKSLTTTLALDCTDNEILDISLDLVSQLPLDSVILFGKSALLPLLLELGL